MNYFGSPFGKITARLFVGWLWWWSSNAFG